MIGNRRIKSDKASRFRYAPGSEIPANMTSANRRSARVRRRRKSLTNADDDTRELKGELVAIFITSSPIPRTDDVGADRPDS